MSELSISGFPDGGSLSSNPISPVRESPSLSAMRDAMMRGTRGKNFAKNISVTFENLPSELKLFKKEHYSVIFKLAAKCRAVRDLNRLLYSEKRTNPENETDSKDATLKRAFAYAKKSITLQKEIDWLCATLPDEKEQFVLANIRDILSLARRCNRFSAVSIFLGLEKKRFAYDPTRPYARRKGVLTKEQYKEYKREIKRKARKKKKETDINFRILCSLRNRLREAIKCNRKSGRTVELLGCKVSYLRAYLEAKWKPGMSWENYGTFGWHIDHIRPCASFDLSDPLEQAKCFHYKNLQPLWAKENIAKGAKYDPNHPTNERTT